MKNLWIQKETPVVTWAADLTALLSRPTDLLGLFRKILDLGIRWQVHIVDEEAVSAVELRWVRDQVIHWPPPAKYRPRARLAWYDHEDRLTEGEVDDLGGLLGRLEPTPGAIPSIYREEGSPPLEISGASVRYAGESLPPVRAANGPFLLAFSTYSDVWFPFVAGCAHPWVFDTTERRMFDNRDLARRHTPRLNGFLADVSAAVTSIGGAWGIEDAEVDRTLRPWIDRAGVSLHGPVPDMMPDEAMAASWPVSDEE